MLLHGYADCLGVPGADMWKLIEREDLADYTLIRLHKDGDVTEKTNEKSGGETFVASGARRLRDLKFEGEITVIEYPPDTKEPNALHVRWLDDLGAFEAEFAELLKRAEPLTIESRRSETTHNQEDNCLTGIDCTSIHLPTLTALAWNAVKAGTTPTPSCSSATADWCG
jgi:hypothetical protein